MEDRRKKSGNIAEIYATLVGRVDRAITALERMTEDQKFDWFHVIRVTEMLKAALLEAEDAYIDMEEPEIITLPPRIERPMESSDQASGSSQTLPTAQGTTRDNQSSRS